MSLNLFVPYPAATADYLWNISDRYRYAYLANPKAATTGILRALQCAERDEDAGEDPEEKVHDREASPLLSVSGSLAGPEQIFRGDEYFRFTYVRNPFTRLLSAYLDKIVTNAFERNRLAPTLDLPTEGEISFLTFLQAIQAHRDSWRDIHWVTQSRIVQSNNIAYHFIGRFENWQATFPVVMRRLGLGGYANSIGVPPHKTGAAEKVREFIGPSERDIILTVYEADFHAFEYSPDLDLAAL